MIQADSSFHLHMFRPGAATAWITGILDSTMKASHNGPASVKKSPVPSLKACKPSEAGIAFQAARGKVGGKMFKSMMRFAPATTTTNCRGNVSELLRPPRRTHRSHILDTGAKCNLGLMFSPG